MTIFLVYGQVSNFDFIHYDDPVYVYQNPYVQAGLTIDTIKWAFTSVVAGNWSPVTLLSHVLVYQFFRLQSGMHHLVNVLFHALAAWLLFAALERASHARWPSAFVAFVFAVHPLHVESVAWVSERKDVLSAFFWFLALYGYVRYVEKPGWRPYLWVTLALALGLMSKTMLVTFPFTLLLLDVWPLRRGGSGPIPWKMLVREKIPLFAVCAAGLAAAFVAQQSGGAFSEVSLGMRVENSLISYVTYMRQMFWPVQLTWFYLYPGSIPVWQAVAALAVVAGITALAIVTWRTRPYFATGWFWYLGTLVPVIGLVQLGAQSHADRYTYIPMVGLSMVLAWGAADLIRSRPGMRMAVVGIGVAAGCVCMALASTQVSYWQDGPTLFRHALEVTPDNFWAKYNLALAHNTMANELMNSGHRMEAIAHFEEALRYRPDWAEAHNNLGILLAEVPGRASEAIAHFEAAVALDPNLGQAQRNLGMALAATPGRAGEAIAHLEAAQRLQPDPRVLNLLNQLKARN